MTAATASHQHPTYNRERFPHFVCNHGNWDIFASDNGYCAAIPSAEGEQIGCRATHFGSLAYTRQVLREEIAQAQGGAVCEPSDDLLHYGIALATEVPA